jgi:hypothetical protein
MYRQGVLNKLVGVTEIAELLNISRQRADQLTRSKGWPDPVERVAPLDVFTVGAMDRLFEQTPKVTLEEALDALDGGAYQLPPYPRLWRVELIEQWAVEHGRRLSDPAD